YIKEQCEKVVDGVSLAVETRLYRKEGQSYLDPHTRQLMTNAFESSGRLDVYRIDRQEVPETAAAADAAPAAESGAAVEAGAGVTDPQEQFLAGRTRECPGCDLAGADLRRLDLS